MAEASKRTLVLGLGNPILTDDGVGVKVAEAVRAALPPDTTIEVSEVSVGGLTLMELMIGYERVILIDALHERVEQPGTIHRWTLDDLQAISPTQHSASPHDASLVTAFALGQRMGLPLPAEVIIYAVEVENILDFSDEPTPAVAAAIPHVTEAVLAELRGGNGV
jgi:hydrogenase maturation protease